MAQLSFSVPKATLPCNRAALLKFALSLVPISIIIVPPLAGTTAVSALMLGSDLERSIALPSGLRDYLNLHLGDTLSVGCTTRVPFLVSSILPRLPTTARTQCVRLAVSVMTLVRGVAVRRAAPLGSGCPALN